MGKPLCLLIACLASVVGGKAAETNLISSALKMPAKKKLHLYLLMGQSNMAGRGNIEVEDTTPHPRVFVFRSNAWEIAVEPITRDRKAGLGVGPSLAFGKIMAEKNRDVVIGLVPCAVGGTPLSRWSKGGDLYSNAVFTTQCAMRKGTLKGILWHQGESECGDETKATNYGNNLAKMIGNIRSELGDKNLPFVVGQLGEFLYPRDKSPFSKVVNEGISKIPEIVPHTACALSKGLNHKGDVLHFDAASEREFGKRYAAEMIRLQSPK